MVIGGGFSVDVSSNYREVAADLTYFERKQIPFALSGAINDTVFDVRGALIDEWNLSFPKSRNKGVARAAMRVKKATKQNLVGVVYDSLETDFILRQATGGVKRAYKGRTIAIPQYGRGKITRTKWGPKAGQQAGQLINGDGRYFSGKPKGHPNAPAGIYKRLYGVSRKSEGLRLVYVYRDSVFVRQDFDAYEVTESTTARRFPIHWARKLSNALATAK